MVITVLGATGRTGTPLVEQALQRGHRVRALVRSPDKAERVLPRAGDALSFSEGDLLAPETVARALSGSSAVIDVTGHAKGAVADLRFRAAGVLLPLLRECGVERLVALTGAGVRHHVDRPGLLDRVARGAMLLMSSDELHDNEAYVATVASSELSWTVVRAPRLVDAPPRGTYRTAAGLGGGTGVTLGRADLARFLLDEVEQGTWLRQMPVVSW